jgi:hypothetical protein
VAVLASPFKSKIRLEAENAALRHQLVVLRRQLKGRARLTNNDRWFFVQLYRWFPSILPVVMIIRPETLVRWHRAGFRRYWRWKSRRRGGRPQIEAELRALIRQMSRENLLWGAPRIHGWAMTVLALRSSRSAMMALLSDCDGCCAPLGWWRSAYLMVLRAVCESKASLVSSVPTTETLEAWCRAYDGNDALDDLGRKSPQRTQFPLTKDPSEPASPGRV